jgi:hypothetical protein
MSDRVRSTSALVTALIALVVSGVSVGVSVDQTDGGGHKTRTIEFHVNQGKGDGAPTAAVSVPAAAAQQVAAAFPDKGMRDETPPLAQQVAPGQLTAAQQAAARIRATQAPLPTAGATQGVPGCETRFVQNQSSRNGVRPQQIWLHYTVSHNVPGYADMLSVLHLFDTRAFQASSNFLIDGEGHCYYMVPIENKSWAQAAANPFAVSIEVIDYGNEATYMASPGYLKLSQVVLTISQRTGIPIVQGEVRGCVPVKRGVVQHADGGICSGGHHDINPFSLAQQIRVIQGIVAKLSAPPITAGQRKRCTELNTRRRASRAYHRRYRRPGGRTLTPHERRRNARLRAGFRSHHLRCLVGPPGKKGTLLRG